MEPPRASVNSCADGPKGCNRAETMIFVSRTTRVMNPVATGIGAGLYGRRQFRRRSLPSKADRDRRLWRFPKTCRAIPVPDRVRAAAGHIPRQKCLLRVPWPRAMLFARQEFRWSTRSWAFLYFIARHASVVFTMSRRYLHNDLSSPPEVALFSYRQSAVFPSLKSY